MGIETVLLAAESAAAEPPVAASALPLMAAVTVCYEQIQNTEVARFARDRRRARQK